MSSNFPSTLDTNGIIPLATAAITLVFVVVSSVLSICFKNHYYLPILRNGLLFFQSVAFYVEFDRFLSSNYKDTIVDYFKYFNVLNLDRINSSIVNEIAGNTVETNEFWSIYSYFFVKACLFLVLVVVWELFFGWISYCCCLFFRAKSSVLRAIYNYPRYVAFSTFYILFLFPTVSVMLRPIFFPFQLGIDAWDITFICMASVCLLYIFVKLVVFFGDIYVHQVHRSKYKEYVSEIHLNDEDVPIARLEETTSGTEARRFSSHSDAEQASGHSTQATSQPSSTIVQEIQKKHRSTTPMLIKKSQPHRRPNMLRVIICEPFFILSSILQFIFFRPSIIFKVFVERYESIRNVAIVRLPKQNLNSTFGAAIGGYKEGDNALFELDYIIFRIIVWCALNGATTFLYRENVTDGNMIRSIVMTSYQALVLLHYMVHLPHRHWYQRASCIFFDFLTLGVLACFLTLTVKPDIENQAVVIWCIYGAFCAALVGLVIGWIGTSIRRCFRCAFKISNMLKSRKRREESSKKEEGVDDQSHHDIVQVLTESGDHDNVLSRAGAGLAEANPDKIKLSPRLELNRIDTRIPRTPHDNNFIQHDDEEESEISGISEELESVATDDSIMLDFDKFSRRKSSTLHSNILLTPQDEDLKPKDYSFEEQGED